MLHKMKNKKKYFLNIPFNLCFGVWLLYFSFLIKVRKVHISLVARRASTRKEVAAFL